MGSETDVEAYSINQLAMAGIKALRRIAGALERQNEIYAEVNEKTLKIQNDAIARMEAREAQRVTEFGGEAITLPEIDRESNKYWKNGAATGIPLNISLPDNENPDSETDLGLTEEEQADIEKSCFTEDQLSEIGKSMVKELSPKNKGKK